MVPKSTKSMMLSYHALVPFGIAMVIYYLHEKYFRENEMRILKEIKSKIMAIKVFSNLFMIFVIVVLFWGHFFNGFSQMLWNSWN